MYVCTCTYCKVQYIRTHIVYILDHCGDLEFLAPCIVQYNTHILCNIILISCRVNRPASIINTLDAGSRSTLPQTLSVMACAE